MPIILASKTIAHTRIGTVYEVKYTDGTKAFRFDFSNQKFLSQKGVGKLLYHLMSRLYKVDKAKARAKSKRFYQKHRKQRIAEVKARRARKKLLQCQEQKS